MSTPAARSAISRWMWIGAVVLVLLVASGCAGTSSSDVDWENYSRAVKQRIDRMAEEGDCTSLQAEFDQADANDDLQRSRVSDGNADLMGYIDEQMRSAGCYG